ncbi:SDR family oxidoreductase [Halovulum sp. GXIMD14793]
MTPENLFSLKGKTALVTGGATGIGRMAAEGLAAAGADVMIASRKGNACEKAAAELNALGLAGTVTGFAGDVGTVEGVEALAHDVTSRTDRLDILMNNAGVSWGAPMGEFPYDAWQKVMSVNVAGLFHLTQTLLPLLQAAGTADDPARVVNVGSVMGDREKSPAAYSYSASKAAVHHLTEILANELAGKGVNVNAIAPGPFVSNMTAFVTADETTRDKVAKATPMGRVGQPSDIAGCMQFLCGKGSSYITGAVIPVSGGINVDTGPGLFDAARQE